MNEITAAPAIHWTLRPEMRIVLAAVAAGALDLVYALSVNAAHGVPPGRVLQFIGSGLLGPAAFHGGAPAAALGAVAHFGLMSLFACAVALAGALPLTRQLSPILLGAAAGACLFVVMNYIVVPLSRTPPLPPLPIERLMLEFVVHAALIGPIVALLVLRGSRVASA